MFGECIKSDCDCVEALQGKATNFENKELMINIKIHKFSFVFILAYCTYCTYCTYCIYCTYYKYCTLTNNDKNY